jgi:hypothetical protein
MRMKFKVCGNPVTWRQGPNWAAKIALEPFRATRAAMSALDHERLSHLAPSLAHVRYASDSDRSRHGSEPTRRTTRRRRHCKR